MKNSDNCFLLNFRNNVTSQYGEDGIIEKIFEIIKDQNKWCVEFGAWDGIRYSNTFNLLKNKNWSGVLIEGNKNKYKELCNTYKGNQHVSCINKYISFNGQNTLDHALSETSIPINFDFLSVDIDGNDYHIWDSLKKYKPKVVVIEYNPTIPNNIEFVQKPDPDLFQGTSILSFVTLAKQKGYELICVNHENAFFVEKQYFPLFNILDNSIDTIKDFKEPLQVFQLFDGTLVFHGSNGLYWHQLTYDFNKLQPLPKIVRNLPWKRENKNLKTFIQRIIMRLIILFNRKIKTNPYE
jgi:hypothetical protein